MKINNSILNAALDYSCRGWLVLPVKAKGKIPTIKNWPNRATTDKGQIYEWFGGNECINIGILTGKKSRLWVLDIDVKHEGLESLKVLEAEYGKLPDTVRVKTGGGGLHYYFKYPQVGIKNSSGMIAQGIDVRGEGGFVVAPPSLHESGNFYQWIDGGPDDINC